MPLKHLEALGLDRVHVRDRDRAAGAQGEVEGEPLAVGGGGGLDEGGALARYRVLERGAWSDHGASVPPPALDVYDRIDVIDA